MVSNNIFKITILIYVINLITSLLINNNEYLLDNSLIIKICVKAILIFALIIAISKSKRYFKIWNYNLYFLLVGFLLLYLAITSKTIQLKDSNLELYSYEHLLFLFSCIITGVFEELLFRVFLFNGIIKSKLSSKKNEILVKSILWTSLLFGIAHISNLLNPNYHIYSVISQIIIAFGLGLLFQSLYIRFKNISILIILHSIINYFGAFNSKLLKDGNDLTNDIYTFSEFKETIIIFVFFLIFIVIPLSYLTIKRELKHGITLYKKI